MKISIGMNLTTAPWGGGNQFGNVLKTYLEKSGCYVVTDLRSEDIDIILLTEPRSRLTSSAYNDRNIQKYQKIFRCALQPLANQSFFTKITK